MNPYRTVGITIAVFSLVLFLVSFNYIRTAEQAILEGHEVSETGACLHPPEEVCPYSQLNKLAFPKYLSLGGSIALFLFGIALTLFASKEHLLRKLMRIPATLSPEEKRILSLLQKTTEPLYQSAISTELGTSKVTTTRLLDKLESKGLIERKRRGMTNLVVLKR